MEDKMTEIKSEEKAATEAVSGVTTMAALSGTDWVEPNPQSADRMSAFGPFSSGDLQNQYNSTHLAGYESARYMSDYIPQASNQNVDNCGEYPIHRVNENYSDYYKTGYYDKYYQQCKDRTDYSEADNSVSKESKPRPIDLINKALAKQHLKSYEDNRRSTDNTKDEDEEEGQIPSSPRFARKGSSTLSDASSTPMDSTSKSMSRSRSPSKERLLKSRSRSRTRRSRSPSRRRRRTRSRSRSPYFGPIIKDYRRGRRGFVRYPRGFRDRGMRSFRRGHHQHYNSYGFSRRHEFSRSRSRSMSPKRRRVEIDKSDNNSDEEKTNDSKLLETLKPSDIKLSEKRLTQSFLAMLEEKQNKSKLIPIETTRSEAEEADDHFNRQHGFVNTFNTVREIDSRKHTLSYDLEREGWQVIDDANSESGRKMRYKSKEEHKYEDNKPKHLEVKELVETEKVVQKKMSIDSSSSADQNKRKKSKKRKKRRKRKVSTSSDSSDSESENGDEVESSDKKKKSKKKKKKTKKKKKKVLTSSSSSEDEDKVEKQKKKRRKKRESSTDSESADKPEDDTSLGSNSKLMIESNDSIEKTSSIANEVMKEVIKSKDKKKKKRKAKDSDSSDSDSDLENKKRKKKNKKKKSKKRRHCSSSSSSSSESSDSSESGDRKKKKKKKSKKRKLKKHKKDKKSEKKEKSRLSGDDKKRPKEEDPEFVAVLSVGEPPLELKWPKKLIKYTECLPSIAFSVNPKVPIISEDFKQTKDQRIRNIEEIERKRKLFSQFGNENQNQLICEKESEKLAEEYEKFIDELNPIREIDSVSEESRLLEQKMRDKLVKQMHDKNESEKADSVTPSEKRALERLKKQSLHSFNGSEDNRRHDDLKSAPLSAYYSAKVQKSSPIDETDESVSTKTSGTESLHKTNEIGAGMAERSHKLETQSVDNFKIDDKKRTARELIERVKQRKHSNKDSDNRDRDRDRDEGRSSKRMPQIGKIKISAKKSLSKPKTPSITTESADSTQTAFVSQPMKLDMNFDYNWYYRYYMNSVYGVGQYPQVNNPALTSAYFAQYSMLTSYDYNQIDLTNWMAQRGCALDSTFADTALADNALDLNTTQDNTTVKTDQRDESQTCDEPFVSELSSDENKVVKTSEETNVENVDEVVNTKETNDVNEVKIESINENNDLQSIQVLISRSHSELPSDDMNSMESKVETDSPNMSPFSSAKFKHKVKVRVTANSQNDVESVDGNSSPQPPPPPPPARPLMTSFVSSEPQTLPNGQVLPIGTKQIVVHPYQTGDAYKFTADWYYNAFNAQNNTTQTNTS